jgi:hypothetical protein
MRDERRNFDGKARFEIAARKNSAFIETTHYSTAITLSASAGSRKRLELSNYHNSKRDSAHGIILNGIIERSRGATSESGDHSCIRKVNAE